MANFFEQFHEEEKVPQEENFFSLDQKKENKLD